VEFKEFKEYEEYKERSQEERERVGVRWREPVALVP
jgi:hypothetical protein